MKKHFYKLLILTVLTIFAAGCGKDGAVGPQGAKGDKGDTGAKGATGAAGTNGTNGTNGATGANGTNGTNGANGAKGATGATGATGNANVKTDLFTVASADWAYNSTYWFGTGVSVAQGYFTKYYERTNTLITQDVLNTGMVLVYMQSAPTTSPLQWVPIPLSFKGTADYTFNYAYETALGKVRLHFYFVKGTVDPPVLSTYTIPPHQFKVIVVTGTLKDNMIKNHINVNDYSQVSNYLNSIQ